MQLRVGKFIILISLCCIAILVCSCFFPFFSLFASFFRDIDNDILRYDQYMPFDFCGIATDSSDRCYVAFDTSVFVYDKNGNYLYRYLKPYKGSSFDFSVVDDNICLWYARNDTVYTYSQSGKLLRSAEYRYEDAPKYKNFMELRKCLVNGELRYRYHNFLGFWWVTNKENRMIAHIPLIAYCIKLLLFCILVCVLFLIIRASKSIREVNH